MDGALAAFWQQNEEPKNVQVFANDLLKGALEKLPEIDAKIRTLADNWDFERLAVVVTSLAPESSKRDRAFRAWVRFRFRILYRAASRWTAAGRPLSTGPLVHLTNLVANLSAYAENAMKQLEPPVNG